MGKIWENKKNMTLQFHTISKDACSCFNQTKTLVEIWYRTVFFFYLEHFLTPVLTLDFVSYKKVNIDMHQLSIQNSIIQT